MGLFDRIINRLGYAKAIQDAQVPTWLGAAGRAEGTTHIMPEKWKSQEELYRRLSWVNIAVGITARSAATTAFSVKEMIGEETQDIVNHDYEALMYRPNPLMSRFEFLESTVAFRSLTGNAYWWLNKPNEQSPPVEQWIIPSHKIEPVPDERMFLKGYMFDPGDGQKIPLETWEVIHFKSFNPLSVFVGLSPIEAFAAVAVGDLKMQDWNTRLFAENNARLPGILAFADPINDSDWAQMKKDSIESSKLRMLMMLRNVGKGGVEWIQNAISQKDMEFLAGRQFNKEEIFGIYAPGLASMLDVNATEANAISGRATFNEYCLWPILVSMAEKITNNVLPSYGDNLRGEFDDIRFVDRALKLTEQVEYSRTHTIDEVRMEFYGEEPLGDLRGELLTSQVAASPIAVDFMFKDEEEMTKEPEPVPAQLQQFQQEQEPEDVPGEEPEEVEVEGEMKAWRKFAIARLGKKGRKFDCKYVSKDMQGRILEGLKACKTTKDVEAVFDLERFLPLITKIDEGMVALMDVDA